MLFIFHKHHFIFDTKKFKTLILNELAFLLVYD